MIVRKSHNTRVPFSEAPHRLAIVSRVGVSFANRSEDLKLDSGFQSLSLLMRIDGLKQ